MRIDRKFFFDQLKDRRLFLRLSQDQVDSFNLMLDEFETRSWSDTRRLAYILATVYHETDKKMQPVKEYGSDKYLKSKDYYPYYGRDLVHTTWQTNYEKVKLFTGVDVVKNPDLIANLPTAIDTAFVFMERGFYTGKKLADYFNTEKCDWINARRIINGTDRAELIADYAKRFYSCLCLIN